jgi:hypothetical protein
MAFADETDGLRGGVESPTRQIPTAAGVDAEAIAVFAHHARTDVAVTSRRLAFIRRCVSGDAQLDPRVLQELIAIDKDLRRMIGRIEAVCPQ